MRWFAVSFIFLCALGAIPANAVQQEGLVVDSVTVNGKVIRRVLDNGLTVVLKEDHSADVVAMHMWVKTGSIYEQEYAGTGVSHFVEHMLFKGTGKRGVGQIAQEIQSYGGDINAYTSYENTVYTINIESGQFDKALEILADALRNSSFDPGEFQKERDVIIKEINMNEDDPDRFIAKLFWSTAYLQQPAKDPVIGYEELFKNLSRQDVVQYYKTRYTPNNMVLVAVGDFSAQAALEHIEKLFADFPRGVWSTPLLPEEPRQLGPRKLIEYRDLGQAYALVGFHGPSVNDPDMPAMDVLSIILGEGRSSRLYQEAREKRGLVSNVGTWSYTPSFPGVFGVSASLAPEKLEEFLALFWAQVRKLHTEPVRPEELAKAKAQTASEYYFSLATMAGQASDLGSSEVVSHDPLFSQEYIKKVAGVTVEDIQRVARKYLQEDLKNEVFLLPEGTQVPGEATTEAKRKEPQISSQTLSNGLRVLIREDHSVPTVSMKVLFNGGLLAENEKNNGISNLFAEMLLKGTRKHTGEEIAAQLELEGGHISSYSGNNSLGFSIDVMAAHWKPAMELLTEILLEPSFPKGEFEREKRATLLEIQSLEDQIFQTASKLFRQTLFKGHPYQFMSVGNADSVRGLRREDLMSFHKDYAVSGNTVLAVFGDVKASDVLSVLEKGLAKLPKGQPHFPQLAKPGLDKAQEVSKTQVGKQAMILLGYPGTDVYHPDRYVFEVMDALFSGLGSRVFQAIRDAHGLAYLVGCYQVIGVEPGAFVFYAGTVPQSVDFVTKELKKEIEKIKKEGVNPEELERAKRGLIGARKIQLQTNSQLALQTGLDELYGLGWDNYKKYYEKIRAVQVQDIQRVANAYFLADRSVLAIVQPPEGRRVKHSGKEKAIEVGR